VRTSSGGSVAEAESSTPVICDAGPLIHLDELGCPDLLRDFAGVLVADAVWQEVARHRPTALRRRSVKIQRRALLPEPSRELTEMAQAFSLDAGEFETLRLMQEVPNAILLTDDAAARLVAEKLSYEVHGTIGVVVRALRRRQRTKRHVLNLLRSIPRRSTLFVSKELLESIIEEVREA
jgi:predicted nucleic acid-binding protein